MPSCNFLLYLQKMIKTFCQNIKARIEKLNSKKSILYENKLRKNGEYLFVKHDFF